MWAFLIKGPDIPGSWHQVVKLLTVVGDGITSMACLIFSFDFDLPLQGEYKKLTPFPHIDHNINNWFE